MLLAKSKEFQKHFNGLLANGQVKKVYQAIVQGDFTRAGFKPGQVITHFMKPSPMAPKIVEPFEYAGWQKCSLVPLNFEKDGDTSWIDIDLLTGRPQQIRAQLAKIGHPIIGDLVYGSQIKLNEPNQIKLQSRLLSFADFKFTLEPI